MSLFWLECQQDPEISLKFEEPLQLLFIEIALTEEKTLHCWQDLNSRFLEVLNVLLGLVQSRPEVLLDVNEQVAAVVVCARVRFKQVFNARRIHLSRHLLLFCLEFLTHFWFHFLQETPHFVNVFLFFNLIHEDVFVWVLIAEGF